MTRVTDEDLEALDWTTPSGSAAEWKRVRTELLALRKVAAAAVKFRDHDGGAGSVEVYARLTRALREAGL